MCRRAVTIQRARKHVPRLYILYTLPQWFNLQGGHCSVMSKDTRNDMSTRPAGVEEIIKTIEPCAAEGNEQAERHFTIYYYV